MMRWLFFLVAVAWTVWGTVPVRAAGATAGELAQSGLDAYATGRYAEAQARMEQFLADFGKNEQTKVYREGVLRILALALIRQGKYPEAVDPMRRYLEECPEGGAREEFSYWIGVCHLKAGDPGKAQAALEAYVKAYPKGADVSDARFAIGACLLEQGKWKEAAAVLQEVAEKGPARLRPRAQVLALHAEISGSMWDAALQRVVATDSRAEEFDAVAAFHFLAMQLGDRMMELDRPRDALRMFQRVWTRKRILERQEARLARLEAELKAAEAKTGGAVAEGIRLRERIEAIKGELARLAPVGDYDAALRMRIARCFYLLDRFREAHLVLVGLETEAGGGALAPQAARMRMTCLAEMERWEEIRTAADRFFKAHPQHEGTAEVLYLKAEASLRLKDFAMAADLFRRVALEHPAFPQVERASFLSAYCLLMVDRNGEALERFDRHLKEFPRGAMREQAFYWRTMALVFDKKHTESREGFAAYLREYPKGKFRTEAVFRRAQALYYQRDFREAYRELEAFLKDHGRDPLADEARVLLGDTYFALGELERGMRVFREVTTANRKFFDHAWFQISKAFKMQDQIDRMLEHNQRFLAEHRESPRVAEALANVAWIYRQQGKNDEARELYWSALETHGNNPEARAVEGMFLSLARLYKGEQEKAVLLAKLRDGTETAREKKESVKTVRFLWAQARLIERSSPERARALLHEAAGWAVPAETSPALLGDLADAFRLAGRNAEAAVWYEDLLRWHPRAVEKDRAYAGLGLLALREGKEKKALDYFARFEQETVSSPLRSEVLRSRAGLYLERGRGDLAIADLEEILKIPSARGKAWVEALQTIGEIHLKEGRPEKAVPYFQRIYVMYGRWTEQVARAYWQSGQAFEKMKMRDEALKTYRELVAQTHLKDTPEFALAGARLKEEGL